MACAARRDVNAARLTPWRVALIAGPVRVQIIWKSSRNTSARRSMTSSAACLWSCFGKPGHVLRVVIFGVEASKSSRECFDRRVLLAQAFRGVTDQAEGSAGSIELRLVTTDAGFVSGKFRLNRVIVALVADGATPTPGERRMRAR